jgi:YrbI family 3-deoxy-D-manno-octulosonate 8-phosphate phosphatase
MRSRSADGRAGAVVVADEACLRRVGPTNGLLATLNQLERSQLLAEVLVVTDSDEVRRVAATKNVRSVGWQELTWWRDMGPLAGQQVPVGQPGAGSPTATGSSRPEAPNRGTVPPPSHNTTHAARSALMRVSGTLTPGGNPGALWTTLGLSVVVFVDACCPLWEQGDLVSVLEAGERSGRSFLALPLERAWSGKNASELRETYSPLYVELKTLQAFSLIAETAVVPDPVLSTPFKGWSLRDPVEAVAISAIWRERHLHHRAGLLPHRVSALAMDFDGVHTDNRVLVGQEGHESVWCNRSDGLGIELLRKSGVPMVVMSKERNPVVEARCKKLQIPYVQSLEDKLGALKDWAEQERIPAEQLVFLGNDINDLECMRWAGCAVAVNDSHAEVLRNAHIVLNASGGNGAVRELCELILLRNGARLPTVT